MHMCIPYWNSIALYVMVEYDVTQKLYNIKDQYAQVHIVNLSQATYFREYYWMTKATGIRKIT